MTIREKVADDIVKYIEREDIDREQKTKTVVALLVSLSDDTISKLYERLKREA